MYSRPENTERADAYPILLHLGYMLHSEGRISGYTIFPSCRSDSVHFFGRFHDSNKGLHLCVRADTENPGRVYIWSRKTSYEKAMNAVRKRRVPGDARLHLLPYDGDVVLDHMKETYDTELCAEGKKWHRRLGDRLFRRD